MTIAEYNETINKEMSEYAIQCQLTVYLKSVYPDVLWTASAGGMRTSVGTGKKMKATGYSKGCPDVFIFESRKSFIGLVIELKTIKGVASFEQKKWIGELKKRNYLAVFCYGLNEAKKVIDEYFAEK